MLNKVLIFSRNPVFKKQMETGTRAGNLDQGKIN